MLHDIKKNCGFTLVELLVAIAIIGIIATISTQLLWDTVTSRSKQDSIEVSSENMRTFIDNLTNYIQEANSITIPDSSTIKIKGDICRTIQYDSEKKKISEGIITTAGCEAPDMADIEITQEGIDITKFEFSPTGPHPSTVSLKIEYDDTMNNPLIKSTEDKPLIKIIEVTITPRVTI